jgi:hypothetical protein
MLWPFIDFFREVWNGVTAWSASGSTSHIFESSSLTLILLLGYLGFDRVGEKNTKKKISEVFDRVLNTRKESASLYFKKPLAEFDFQRDVGPGYVCTVYLIKSYVGFCNKDEKPPVKDSNSPSRFSLYWVICDSIEDKDDNLPLKFAAIAAIKFFLLCLFGIFTDFHWAIVVSSILFDATCVAWVVRRVYLLTEVEPVLDHHIGKWDKWFESQTQKVFVGPLNLPQTAQ